MEYRYPIISGIKRGSGEPGVPGGICPWRLAKIMNLLKINEAYDFRNKPCLKKKSFYFFCVVFVLFIPVPSNTFSQITPKPPLSVVNLPDNNCRYTNLRQSCSSSPPKHSFSPLHMRSFERHWNEAHWKSRPGHSVSASKKETEIYKLLNKWMNKLTLK